MIIFAPCLGRAYQKMTDTNVKIVNAKKTEDDVNHLRFLPLWKGPLPGSYWANIYLEPFILSQINFATMGT